MSKRIAVACGLFVVGVAGYWLVVREPPKASKGSAKPAPKNVRPRPPSPVFDETSGSDAAAHDRTATTPGFIRVQPGTFQMGSPGLEPDRSPDELRHRVTISYPFEIQATEVTQREYKTIIGKNPSYSPECGPDCPVEQVSWFEAAHYCNELSRRRGLPLCTVITEQATTWKGLQCQGFRLPTEAEWEYAARAGSTEDRHAEVDKIAWIDTNSLMKSHKVAELQPNAWGIYDMLGNVFEWTWDWIGPFEKHAVADPTGPPTGKNKVFRGGAYRWTKGEARHAFRNAYGPLNKVEFVGFRCVRTLR